MRLDFKRPWSNGTSAVELEPVALIARLAALVPPPRRHTVRYVGVLSSHAELRSQIVPKAATQAQAAGIEKPSAKSRYIPWAELLRRTFGIETVCQKCKVPLRLISLIRSEPIARKILIAMHLPADVPELHPARPPPGSDRGGRDTEDWVS